MVQEVEFIRVKDELFQIDSTSEKGEQGRGHWVELPRFFGSDDEGTEERKWSGTDFGVCDNVLPVRPQEFEMPDLSKTGRKEGDGAGGRIVTDGDVQGGSFCALEEGSHVDLASSEE